MSAELYAAADSRQSLYENTVAWIENLVMENSYKSGEKLPSEREMCEAAGVSRTVLREALRAVESKGLLTIFAGKGVYVRNPDLESVTAPLRRLMDAAKVDFHDLMQARHFIEPSIAYLAGLKATDQHIAKLEADQEKMRRTMYNADKFMVADQNFHFDLVTVTGNPMLIIMVQTITNALSSLHALISKPGRTANVLRHHENILNALRQRAPGAAYQAMEDHLLDVEEFNRSIQVQKSLEARLANIDSRAEVE